MLNALRNWIWPSGRAARRPELAAASGGGLCLEPFAYIIDDEAGICDVMSKILATLGVESEIFHTAKDALASLDRRAPAVIFLDVALMQSDAIDVIHGLNDRRYSGTVHLMSGGNPSLLEAVQRIGARKGLTFGPPLHKPFRRATIVQLVEGLALTSPS
jgi:DNA-binding NtrC family response regulator